jgi:DNA polymerase III epsilon subunit-like protein
MQVGLSHEVAARPFFRIEQRRDLPLRFGKLEDPFRKPSVQNSEKRSVKWKDRFFGLMAALRDRFTPLSRTVTTVLDTETTGLEPSEGAHLLEITAIKYKKGKEIGRFSTLIKPKEAIDENSLAVRVNHITNKMVQDAPNAKSALTQLGRFVGKTPCLVGQNINFDLNFIRAELQENGLADYVERFSNGRAWCTKTLAQEIFEKGSIPGGLKLENLAAYFGITNPDPHRATGDVGTTYRVFENLLRLIQQHQPNVRTIRDLFAFQGPPITAHDGVPTRPGLIPKL